MSVVPENTLPDKKSKSELYLRVMTGVFGAAALIALLVFGGVNGTTALALLLSLGMCWEFGGIVFQLEDQNAKKLILVLLAAWIFSVQRFLPDMISGLGSICSVFGILSVGFLFGARRYSDVRLRTHVQEMMYAFFGLLYLAYLPLFLIRIRELQDGLQWILLFFSIVWSTDTGAYFVGKRFGRHKLYPIISPKKTLEGSAGGLLAAIAVTIAFWAGFFKTHQPGATFEKMILLSLAVSVTAQLGDLLESMLKRAFDKKDSGSILPGHGGVLDRFDAVVFSLPVMYGCVIMILSSSQFLSFR